MSDAPPISSPAVGLRNSKGAILLPAVVSSYRLLSEGFQYPDETSFRRLESGFFARELEDSVAQLSGTIRLQRLASSLRQAIACTVDSFSLLDLQAAYNRLFVLSVIRSQGNMSLHGTSYTAAHEYMQSHQLAELSNLYHCLGLQCAAGVRPDNISSELEFLEALAAREALAGEMGQAELSDRCRRQARDFLKGHFLVWIPALCRALTNRRPPLYPALARLTRGFASWHLTRLDRERS